MHFSVTQIHPVLAHQPLDPPLCLEMVAGYEGVMALTWLVWLPHQHLDVAGERRAQMRGWSSAWGPALFLTLLFLALPR